MDLLIHLELASLGRSHLLILFYLPLANFYLFFLLTLDVWTNLKLGYFLQLELTCAVSLYY